MRAMTVPALSGTDYTYQAGGLFIWTSAEVASTIVAASIPILRVLFNELKHSRYPRVTELHTFKSMRERGGIQVTKETIVSRSVSMADRMRRVVEDEDVLLTPRTPRTPRTPMPTYHSYMRS